MTVYTVVHLPRLDGDDARATLWVGRYRETGAELNERVDDLCAQLIGLGDWYVEVSLNRRISLATWIAQPYQQYRLYKLAILAYDDGDSILAGEYEREAERYTLSPHLVTYFAGHVAFIALQYGMEAHTHPGHKILVYCGGCAKSYPRGLAPEFCERCGTMEYTGDKALAMQNAAEPYTEHLIRQWQKPEVRARFKSQVKNKTQYGAWRWNDEKD